VSEALPGELRDGYRRFRETRYQTERERYRRLEADGQRPTTIVIACSDSRSAPETIFDALPGELFVVRNVGALVPVYAPDTRSHAASSALEYAVIALHVRSIVVLGHGRCGAVSRAIDDSAPLTSTDFIGTWIAGIRDIADELEPGDWADPAKGRQTVEFRTVEQSVLNLRTFPWIRSRESAGTLRLSGAWFDIGLGELLALGADGWHLVP